MCYFTKLSVDYNEYNIFKKLTRYAFMIDDRGYGQLYEPSEALDVRTERRVQYMLDAMTDTVDKQILEIGCGDGTMSYLIALKTKSAVLGTDLCAPFIKMAMQNHALPNLAYEVMDFNKPDKLSERKFDYIVGNGILHHLYYTIDEALLNLIKLLNENGKIVFLEPNLLNPYCYLIFNTTQFFRSWAKLEPAEKAFTKTFITRRLDHAGFKNIHVEYRDFLLPITPSWLIRPSIYLGAVVEKITVLKMLAQSLYICAEK